MSIKLKSNEDLQALQNTLIASPHIQKIHFTRTGDHYFTVHEFMKNNKPTGKVYGKLRTEMVHNKTVGERKFFKLASIETPEAEIVETLTREEILKLKIDGAEVLSKKDQKVLDKITQENEALRAELEELKNAKS